MTKQTVQEQANLYKVNELKGAEKEHQYAHMFADARLEAVKWLIERDISSSFPGVFFFNSYGGGDVRVQFQTAALSDARKAELRKALKKAPFAWQLEGDAYDNIVPAYVPKVKS